MDVRDTINLSGFYPDSLKIIKVSVEEDKIIIEMKSQKHSHECRKCEREMTKYHATYPRTVQDLPILGKQVVLKIRSYNYYCDNNECEVKSFVEDYESFIGKSKRMTYRCEELVKTIALETSCEGASAICKKLGIRISGDTIINMLKNESAGKATFYEVNPGITSIGIDDFAYKKGQSYCTIICDGERHRPIEVLEGRDGKTLKEWLTENKKHMKITQVSRDRASAYAKVIAEILPEAMQIADRFHLHQNLLDAVKKAIKEILPNEIAIPNNFKISVAEPAEAAKEENNSGEEVPNDLSRAEQRRYEDIVRIQEYLSQGYSAAKIKELLNTTYNTIRRYATGDPYKLCRFPQNGARTINIEDYREEIMEYLHSNMMIKDIYAKITENGYNGKHTQVKVYCKNLAVKHGIEYSSRKNSVGVVIAKNKKSDVHYISSRDVLNYIWSDKELNLPDVLYIMTKYPQLWDILKCVRDFRNIYTEKSAVLLLFFVTVYSFCSIQPIKSFVSGLRNDYDAVKNSVLSDLSNGFVEGNNNKVKLIKRSMYGRAKLDLLRAKILLAR